MWARACPRPPPVPGFAPLLPAPRGAGVSGGEELRGALRIEESPPLVPLPEALFFPPQAAKARAVIAKGAAASVRKHQVVLPAMAGPPRGRSRHEAAGVVAFPKVRRGPLCGRCSSITEAAGSRM